jgi:protein-S-isoprenylcysteine O-methyltransferase Ste14
MRHEIFRWLSLAILLGTVGVSGYYRRLARQSRETIARLREGRLVLAMRMLVALPLFLIPIANVAAPASMAWAFVAVPEWLRLVGAVIGLSAVVSVRWVLRSLGPNVSETVLTKQRHELVTSGPYRWVRHPLYTTALAMFLSVGLLQASWIVLLFSAVAALLIRLFVIPAEERQLLAKFGDRYRAYMQRTGRLLPRVLGRDNPVASV